MHKDGGQISSGFFPNNTFITIVQLVMAVCGSLTVACTVCADTNLLSIGGVPVESKMINGKIVGDRYIVVSNELIRVHVEGTPIPDASPMAKGNAQAKVNPGPCLRLMMSTGSGANMPGGVKGLRGLMYMAGDFKTPTLAKAKRVEILSTEDNARIVVMEVDNGPIYSSTNSGVSWTTITAPGDYEFPLNIDASGGGFSAAATIRPGPENQHPASSPPANWYAVAAGADGNRLVLTRNNAQGPPALRITIASGKVVVSWPREFNGFVLQGSKDLTATNWTDVLDPVRTVGAENQVTVSDPSGKIYYRLQSR